MTQHTTTPPAERMQCMEIWGGNQSTERTFQTPGLDIHLFSQPVAAAQQGGDLYYLTSCASGRISRLLLADVSGHGQGVSDLAVSLRDLLRRNVNTISQRQFVESMNDEFGRRVSDTSFATAVVATFFQPRRSLSITCAGHPYPVFFEAATGQWSLVCPREQESGEGSGDARQPGGKRLSNLPLGVVDRVVYPDREMQLAPGDMFLLYSDWLIESRRPNGPPLGMGGLLEILNGAGRLAPGEVIPHLRDSVLGSGGRDAVETPDDSDDATLVLGHVTRSKTRWRDNFLAPLRLFFAPRDSTVWRSEARSARSPLKAQGG